MIDVCCYAWIVLRVRFGVFGGLLYFECWLINSVVHVHWVWYEILVSL